MNHILKIHEQFADAVCPLKKTFEVRREDDRRFEVGDRIAFRVVDDGGAYIPSHVLNQIAVCAVRMVLAGAHRKAVTE